jgi:polyisoprenoid-binding protein YceI
MQKRTKIITVSIVAGALVLGGAAAIAGPIVYRDLIAAKPDTAPTVTAAPEAGTDVTVTGRTEQVTGELAVSGLTLESASFEVDVASIATDSANRDDYFRTEALRTAEFPTASFVLTEPITVDAAPAVGEVRTVQATGELTLAGVTKPVTVELQAVLNGATGQVAGSIPITFADFGVEAPNLGFVSVEPNGTVEFSLVLSRA